MAFTRRTLLVACLAATVAARPDRRIVDVVTVGDARSEHDHGYAADGTTTGSVHGRTFRQARGWMRVALNVFDDAEVTVAATLAGNTAPQSFELVVENQYITTY